MVVNFKENTEQLLIERLFKGFDPGRLVEWARERLAEGHFTDGLLKLVTMENREEIEKYFLQSIEELELNIPTDVHAQLQDYANEVARQVLSGEVTQDFGFLQLLKVAKVSNKDFRYQGFPEIEEDLDNLFYGRKTKREGLTLDGQKAHILEEFKLFSTMEMLEIPMHLRQQEYCMICGQLTTPVPKKKYSIRRPFFYHVLSCEHCKSERLKSASQHFVKQRIIDAYASKNA